MISQLGIILLSGTAAYLVTSACANRRRLGCWFGLAAQPFWYWSAVTWVRGIRNNG